ncbi:MAG: ABC transporter substrate-binding protein [Desulfobulbaceae bacterium]|nr:MAG: ABC transporter substrate-binding protein [Desulfobulbaceae bacterium]
MLESHGASRILASFHDVVPNWVFAGLYFSEEYLQENPELTQKVLNGLVKSFEFIKTNEKEARAFLPKYTRVKEELCMIAALREYSPIEPMKNIEEQKQLMVDYGFIKSNSPIENMIDYRFIPEELKNIGEAQGEEKL